MRFPKLILVQSLASVVFLAAPAFGNSASYTQSVSTGCTVNTNSYSTPLNISFFGGACHPGLTSIVTTGKSVAFTVTVTSYMTNAADKAMFTLKDSSGNTWGQSQGFYFNSLNQHASFTWSGVYTPAAGTYTLEVYGGTSASGNLNLDTNDEIDVTAYEIP